MVLTLFLQPYYAGFGYRSAVGEWIFTDWLG